MSSAGMFQTQISAIMAVLAKAAVAEISQLLEEEAAALHQEIRRRNEEIQGLKTRLMLTETELQRVTAEPQRVTAEPQRVTAEPQRCSVGVQVEILMDTSVTTQSWEAQAEKVVVTDLSEEKPHFSHVEDVSSQPLKQEESVAPLREPQEEELGGLEFEMKIEQVEELVDQTLNQVQAEQKHEGQNHREDGSSHLWCSGKAFDRPEGLMESEQHCQNFTDPYVIEDPMTASGLVALENESFSDVNPQDSLRRSTRSDSTPFSRPPSSHSSSCLPKTFSRRACGGEQTGLKPFRCEECGKGFTQRTRLITHRRVHTGEKPFRCEECGKGFTQRTRLLTHRLVHTGEKPFRCQLCGKTFSRQDNCLRHVRLHSGQR